ncbi:MAG TPA: HlyD family secretion protein [Pirellulales bacterium]|nr:HlyD family secretion protein [Pirellulales bacterium]
MKTDFDIGSMQADTARALPSAPAAAAPSAGTNGNGRVVADSGMETTAKNTAEKAAIAGATVVVDSRLDGVSPLADAAPADPAAAAAEAQQRPSRRRIVLICIGLAVLGLAAYFAVPAIYRYFRYESTDDAYINGHVTYISPRIAGRVTAVLVENNQYVEAGQALVRIDSKPFELTVEQKQAALAQAKQAVDQQIAALDVATAQGQQARDAARGQLAAVYADWYMLQTVQTLIGYEVAALKSGVANWKLQQANLQLAQANLKRGQELVPSGAMSREEFDAREAAEKVAKQQVDAAFQAVQQARALLGLPISTGPNGTPDTSVPSDIDETFPGVKFVVASAEQSLAQLGLPIDPTSAKADKIVDKISSLVASEFINHVPAVEVAEAQLRQARAALGGESFDRVHPYNQPSVVRAQKDLDQAELNLSYTELRAPIAGFVNGRAVNPGNDVQVAQSLMSVYPLRDVWVDANFKEGQLDRLRIGQSVDLYIDAYPGHVFPGRVAGFSAGTGAALSLLPPENATGNFVKVVQRLPVRIELTGPAPEDTPLFIGLSVEPEVDLSTEPRGPDAGRRLLGPITQSSK